MKKDLSEIISIIKFGSVGVMNTLINWIIFFVLNKIGIYYMIANIIAYSIATVNSYFWNSIWVFKYNNSSKLKSSIKFILLNLWGGSINTGLLYLLVDKLSIDKMISLVIVTGIVMIINYIVNKLWVFKSYQQSSSI
ncbi:GtrA family protein [Clostridium sp. NSJ-145]|uniref:GtrA family protein n=1 Tax=Clostridium sp. NSJ-145 TaxID=2897777 RepID=UPI001E4B2F3E|nr:GtrA family protein [Clostridium sp. NSJ-145]MCD2502889.1 GtrA family protein [Clostridium sp. NSJ-145]